MAMPTWLLPLTLEKSSPRRQVSGDNGMSQIPRARRWEFLKENVELTKCSLLKNLTEVVGNLRILNGFLASNKSTPQTMPFKFLKMRMTIKSRSQHLTEMVVRLNSSPLSLVNRSQRTLRKENFGWLGILQIVLRIKSKEVKKE